MILSLVLTAIALRLVAGFTPTLEVKGWLPAFLAAAFVLAVGLLAEFAILSFVPKAAILPGAACLFVGNLLAVLVAGLLLPGVFVRGLLGLFLAGALLTVIPFASSFALSGLRLGGSMPAFLR